MIVAIIPARAGSKRIPNKNIKKFKGYPIISWSIKAAIKSKLFDRIIVSTDSKVIAKIAMKHKAEVPFIRPKKISNDHASTVAVIKHNIQWLKSNNLNPKFVCCIYPTAAFLDYKDLILGYKKIKKMKYDYVFSAGKYSSSVMRSFKRLTRQNGLKMLFPKYYNRRTQDINSTYHDAGQFYWGRVDSWLKNKKIFSLKSEIVEIPRERLHDIDTKNDWNYAEKTWSLKNKFHENK